MSARLAALLVNERVLPEGTVRQALARQLVYGGTLDTALLELGALGEAAIWARLAAASGLPVPPPALCDGATVAASPALSADKTAALRAVPVGAEAGALNLMCVEPVAAAEIRAAVAEQGFAARMFIVPEVRMLALRQRVYGESIPFRYAPLLAQILGTEAARKRFARERRPTPAPAKPLAPEPVVVTAEPAPAAAAAAPVIAPEPMVAHVNAKASERVVAEQPTPLEQVIGLTEPPITAPPREGRLVDVEIDPDESAWMTPAPAPGSAPQQAPIAAALELLSSEPVVAEEEIVSFEAAPAEAAEIGETIPGYPRALVAHSAHAEPEPDGAEPVVAIDAEETVDWSVTQSDPEIPTVDAATETLCRRARDVTDRGRVLALRALGNRITHPSVQRLIAELRAGLAAGPAAAVPAAEALAELRDDRAVPLLIDLMAPGAPPALLAAVYRALVPLTATDVGESQTRWRAWWETNQSRSRVEWLLNGLAHVDSAIRRTAFSELRRMSGETFGYGFDLPRRHRERARRRFIAWWEATGRKQLAP